MLVGRDEDMTALSGVLNRVRDGSGGALVLHGDLGVGKSALLSVAACAAAESGIRVIYEPPAPEAVDAGPAELFRLAVATVQRLATHPTVLIVDDAERLDERAWALVAAIGRGLGGHPVGLLVALRDAPANDRRLAGCGLPQRPVGPLTAPAGRRLLDAVAPDLPAPVRDQILTEAQGYPWALVEWGRAARNGDPEVASPAVARALGDLVGALPAQARAILHVAALEPACSLSEVLPAASLVDGSAVTASALDCAVAAGLLHVDGLGRARIPNPMLRRMFARSRGQAKGSATRTHVEAERVPSDYSADDLGKLRSAIERIRRMPDRRAAASLLNALAVRFYWTVPDTETRDALVAAADSLGLPAGDPRLLHVLATADPVERGRAVVERLVQLSGRLENSPYELHLLGIVGNAIAAYYVASTLHAASLPGLRAQGRHAVLARALTAQAWAAAQLGDTRQGRWAAEQARPLAVRTGQPMAVLIIDLSRAHIEALRGNRAAVEEIAAGAEHRLAGAGLDGMLAKVCLVRGVLAIGAGRYEEAYGELRRIFDEKDRAYHPYLRFCALAPLAEAGHFAERDAELRAIADELEPVAERAGSPMLRHGLTYVRAVTAPTQERFREALDAQHSGWPFERARLKLAYGRWLARERRSADARSALRSALATFVALGADAWSARARRLDGSVGEVIPGWVGALALLTAQQRRVARLAAAGLSSREIADRLFLSPRTVTTHLTRIYARIAAGSRADLAQLLAESTDADT